MQTIRAYHGTTPENAKKIEQEGFNPGTYFAYQKDDAKRFGPCVLAADFDIERFQGIPDGWQFWTRERVWADPGAEEEKSHE
jgi:hypothetical protein